LNAPQNRSIQPQPGPQEAFLSTPADIAIYGGSAYSGKSFALVLDPLRHVHDPDFAGVIFRRETTQIRNPGGLWDESCKLYAPLGAHSLGGPLEQRFPSGAVVKFAHLEHVDSVYAWDGAQIPFIGFDQLEHFERSQFFYMLSRNRDPSGKIRPYIRATCNPNPDSWLADFISWWIDQVQLLPDGTANPNYGYAIWERAGIIRYFVQMDDVIYWADSKQELFEQFRIPHLPDDHPEQPRPLSCTFIPGRIWDNKIGISRDPGYVAKLKGMQKVERLRLLGDAELGGNWKVSPAAGLLFRREWCTPLRAVPGTLEAVVRYWDLAATKPVEHGKERAPAWTVGVKLGRYANRERSAAKRFVVLDVRRTQDSPANVRTMIKNTAIADGPSVRIGVPQDPGQAGKDQVQQMVGMLAGFDVRPTIETGDKVQRFNPYSAQCEIGNVDYVLESVPEAYLVSLENFPDGVVKDDADATSGAFRELTLYTPVDVKHGAETSESTAMSEDAPWDK
jgi:predicted phage terminase large subunit-like protein